jgi:hypothetical protein
MMNELDLNATQAVVLAGVHAWAKKSGYTVEQQVTLQIQLRDGVPSNGTECVTNRSTAGCFLDTDDAAYFDSSLLPALEADDAVIDMIVGANSFVSGQAVYSSAAVYTLPVDGGQLSVLGGAAVANQAYTNSAQRFAPPNTPRIDELFALTVRYGSCPPHSSLPHSHSSRMNQGQVTQQWCLNATVTDEEHQVLYVTRAYLNPKTLTGPDPAALLPAVVVRLRRE